MKYPAGYRHHPIIKCINISAVKHQLISHQMWQVAINRFMSVQAWFCWPGSFLQNFRKISFSQTLRISGIETWVVVTVVITLHSFLLFPCLIPRLRQSLPRETLKLKTKLGVRLEILY